jgi:hypothetical protein
MRRAGWPYGQPRYIDLLLTKGIKVGKFEIFRAVNGSYYFRLKSPNGEIICTSEGYTSKQGAQNGVHAVKTYAPLAPVIDLTAGLGSLFRPG